MTHLPDLSDCPFDLADLDKAGVRKGITWAVFKHPKGAHHNGYVRVPEYHPWRGHKHYEDFLWATTQELTYWNGVWAGFDTLHAFQWWPESDQTLYSYSTVMTVPLVIEWAKQLADETAAHWGAYDYQI